MGNKLSFFQCLVFDILPLVTVQHWRKEKIDFITLSALFPSFLQNHVHTTAKYVNIPTICNKFNSFLISFHCHSLAYPKL